MGNPAMILLRGVFTLLLAMLCEPSMAFAEDGSTLYLERCAVCHGADAKGTGPLAQKSNPPTPDLTSATFKARLSDYPGVIVSSVILRPNGNLIPKTLRENGITLPAHTWTDKELRDLNEYMTHPILKN
jgi:mono/diheme cytochrome c family protein